MKVCRSCGRDQPLHVLDCGSQPVCNRFLAGPGAPEELFPLALRQCAVCGLVQLNEPPPAESLRPVVDWISYVEPEGHLDHLARSIPALPGVGPGAAVWGVSSKDDSLLARVARLGCRTYRLDPAADLDISGAGFGVETVQHRLTKARAERIVAARGQAHVVVARHILEHAHDFHDFMSALKTLAAPQGHIILEVPDCERSFALCDYSTIWEEHVLYFTDATFRTTLAGNGLRFVERSRWPYPLEDSLVAILQADPAAADQPPGEAARRERERMATFGSRFAAEAVRRRRELAQFRRQSGAVAVLGAGHLAATFINLLGLAGEIDCVIDDNPSKQGLFMPGSRLPIVPADALIDRHVKLCLLGLNPDIHDRVVQKHSEFTGRGGVFASIFPSATSALPV